MNEDERIDGYYWVMNNYDQTWEVAYWDGVGWEFCGTDGYLDNLVDKVGVMVLNPYKLMQDVDEYYKD